MRPELSAVSFSCGVFSIRISRGKLKWCRLDTWVIAMLIITVGVPLIAWKMPQMKVLENRGGFAMDTFMAYFIARFCVKDYRSLLTVAKMVTPVVIALGILGIMESTYGIQPFFALRKYCPWRSAGGGLTTNVRSGVLSGGGPLGSSDSVWGLLCDVCPDAVVASARVGTLEKVGLLRGRICGDRIVE